MSAIDMMTTFTRIYDKNIWGNGSGAGSSPTYNKKYMEILQNHLRTHSIQSVMDIGCGDWQHSQHMDWNGIDYNGIDVVKSVVDKNNELYGKENIKFFHMDVTKLVIPYKFDLVIIKDVLQHWDDETIITFMDKLLQQGHKQIMIINTAFSNFKKNDDEPRSIKNRYHYCKLDATKAPLNRYNPTILATYKFKQISIITQ
jgi:2-polyprenyl-3-methyl-5-hydroxy-6-metoxy-1,4-benzoquinol methylase